MRNREEVEMVRERDEEMEEGRKKEKEGIWKGKSEK